MQTDETQEMRWFKTKKKKMAEKSISVKNVTKNKQTLEISNK